jgi:uncharacterized protein
VRVISSWLPISPYSPWVNWSYRLSEPLLAPLRRVVPVLGGLDITPIVAYILLGIIESLLFRVVWANSRSAWHERINSARLGVSGLDARQVSGGVRFTVKVQPRASKNEIAGLQGSALKVRVTAPPVEGMANESLIDLISATLKTSRRNVCIVSGSASRMKILEVQGVSLEAVQRMAEREAGGV